MPAGFVPYSATFVSSSQGWVLGTAPCAGPPCTSLLRTRDGGRSWQGIAPPVVALATEQAGAATVTSVRFADSSDGWLFGGALYRTHDGGSSWTRSSLTAAADTQVTALEASAGRVWALVTTSTAATVTIYSSPANVDAWQAVGPSLPVRGVGQLVVHGSDWWVSSGTMLLHGVGSQPATRIASPPCSATPDYYGITLAVADAQHLDALCSGNGASGRTMQRLFGSTDGGGHWTAAGTAFVGGGMIGGISDNGQGVLMLASCAQEMQCTITRTTDDGRTFRPVLAPSIGTTIRWTDVGFTTPVQALAVLGGRALYLSHDAAATWSTVSW